MASVDPALLASFRAASPTLSPPEAEFTPARAAAVWNGSITRQPALIAQPASAEQVARVIDLARSHDLDLTVRGGGHGYAGGCVADGAVMLDLSRMSAVRVDPGRRVAYVGGGATWGDVDAATAEHGLGVVGGMISHTGVAGLTLGGGIGWLSRRLGLACDNLLAARLVTADSRTVRASAQENPDLFWGLRGAGTNFGVVTEFEFALAEVSPMAQLSLFFWRPADSAGPLAAAAELAQTLPRGFGVLVAGLSAPPAPFVPAEFVGRPGYAVVVASWGDEASHASEVRRLHDLGPAFEMSTPIPYVALQQMFDESAPWGALGYEKALYLDDLSPAVVELMIEHLPKVASPLSFTPIFPLNGAFSDVAEDATAFGGSRSPRWVFNISACALDPASFDADRAWVRSYWDALRPHAQNAATYVNFLADVDEERVRLSYGPAKYARLAALKAVWDPDNVFCHNANIRPASLPQPRAGTDASARGEVPSA